MRHLDLFSGIGGFSVAVDAVWPKAKHTFCEIDQFCQQIIKKHWPHSKIYADIKKVKLKRGSADLITGGFPCQPFSQAGKRRGTQDDRHLWPEMLRIIREVRPTWVVGENVVGLISMALEQVCLDLEGEGYEVQPFIIPACAVNAPHRRDRVWIVAHDRYRDDERQNQQREVEKKTGLCRVDDGIPKGLDRGARLKALGNAIVPQVAIEIMRAIYTYEHPTLLNQ